MPSLKDAKYIEDVSRKLGREPINPPGSCFSSAFKMFMDEKDAKHHWLCHGLGIASGGRYKGQLMAHAWIEVHSPGRFMPRFAFDVIWGFAIFANNYRSAFNLQYVQEYTVEEARALALETGYGGPWDERILAHTVQGKRKKKRERR